jgi:hypothetical protein
MVDEVYNKKLKAEYQFLQLECKYQQNLFDEALKEFTVEFKDHLNKDAVSGIEKKKPEKKSLDKIYKKLATKVHPDKPTGNHEEFQKLTKLIDDSDLDGLKEMADEYNMDMEIDSFAYEHSIHNIREKIQWYENTIAYKWKYSDADTKERIVKIIQK